MKFKELQKIYKDNFSLGFFNKTQDDVSSSFEKKIALISLICYVTYKAKLKTPDVTHYQIIMKIGNGLGLSEDLVKSLAVICEDFSYMSDSFPTFGIKGNDIITKIRDLLNSQMPF
jgi:hypothetical protein